MAEDAIPYYDTAIERRPVLHELQEMWRFRNLIFHLARRNITARYKRSLLGIGWTLLDPLMTMVVMTLVYSALFKTSIDDFPVFLLAGIVGWTYFSQASSQAMTDLMYSGGLIGRVYLPKSVFSVAAVGTGLVNLLFSLIPLAILVIVMGRPISLSLAFLPFALIMLSLFILGVGLLISSFAVFFADMVSIYSFLLRLLMFLSGIFYKIEALPRSLQWVVRVNPLYHLIRLFRDPIYEGIIPGWEIIAYATVWSLFMTFIGLWIFSRRSDRFIYHV